MHIAIANIMSRLYHTYASAFAGLFKDAKTVNEQFQRNMFLSLQRAYAVQDYMLLKTRYNRKNAPEGAASMFSIHLRAALCCGRRHQ